MADSQFSTPPVRFKVVESAPAYRVGTDGSVWTRRCQGFVRSGDLRPIDAEWRPLRPSRQKSGHLMVALYAGGKKTYRQVHHLVLEAFVGPCPDGMECCHGEGGPGDNSVGNVRWDTRSANAYDRNRFGRSVTGDGHGRAKVSSADVEAMRATPDGPGRVTALVEAYGLGRTQVRRILSGEQWRPKK